MTPDLLTVVLAFNIGLVIGAGVAWGWSCTDGSRSQGSNAKLVIPRPEVE